jgi:hypothetical protein
MPQKVLRLLVLLLVIRSLSACSASGTNNPGVSTVTIASPLSSIAVSGTEQITATAKDGNGNIINGGTINWASSTPNVAAINAGSGLATGLLPGSTQITASANGITSAPLTLTVTPGFLSIVTLNVARSEMTMTVLNNGMVLIAGGANSGGVTATAELYNPATQTFTLTGSLNTARFNHTATLLDNGMVLIAGGADANSNKLASAELYNPATGTFTPTGKMIVVREQPTATQLQNGKVVIAGGNGLNGALNTAELYDPTTEAFTPAGTMNVTRRLATATLLNDGTLLIAGGIASRGAILDTAEVYDPVTNSFTLTGRMMTFRAVQTATLLNSGMVLIAGGLSPNGAADVPLASAELYDPAKGTFTPTGSLITARTNASATLLNNGTVLFAGGGGPGNPNLVPLTSAEVYDPTAATFTATGSLQVPRLTRTAPLLPNGTVLLAGGFQLPTTKAPAELYEPGPLTPPGLQSIAVAPASPTVSPGAYQPYIATGTFAGGATQQLAAVAWSSSDTNTAQVSNDTSNPGASVAVGIPTATAPVTITAIAGTVSGSSTLNVRPTGFVTTGSMNIARNPCNATRLHNGLVLVADSDGSISTPLPAELYDPTSGTFSFTGSPVTSRINFFTATLLEDGMVLIAGGFGSNGPLANAELYDPVTGLFTATGSLNTARYSHTATLLVNGTVLITGGRTSSTSPLSSAEIFDPYSGKFTPAGNLSTPRSEHTATPLSGGLVLIAGGQGAGLSLPANAEVYNAFSGTFSTVGGLNTPRSFHTATLLQNGTVLIAGGSGSSQELASAELYNPGTGNFAVTGSMSTPRTFHSATLLNSGMVLVAGGGNNLSPSTGVLATTELYDPLTGTFTIAAPLNTARINHAATLLDNGMVLIVGGTNAMILSSAELY